MSESIGGPIKTEQIDKYTKKLTYEGGVEFIHRKIRSKGDKIKDKLKKREELEEKKRELENAPEKFSIKVDIASLQLDLFDTNSNLKDAIDIRNKILELKDIIKNCKKEEAGEISKTSIGLTMLNGKIGNKKALENNIVQKRSLEQLKEDIEVVLVEIENKRQEFDSAERSNLDNQ